VALAVGVFALLPRVGGLAHDAADLRHARPAFVVAAVLAQAVSLGCYAQLYRRVLASLGAHLPFLLAALVTLASFVVSHLTPFGSAAGTVLNVSTLQAQGIAAPTTSEGIGLTSGGPGRARLPARQLLAAAASRRARLSPTPVSPKPIPRRQQLNDS
jgi:uncharacterized membrane protein YbhN (UPF0104 family)